MVENRNKTTLAFWGYIYIGPLGEVLKTKSAPSCLAVCDLDQSRRPHRNYCNMALFLKNRKCYTIEAQITNRWAPSRDLNEATFANTAVPLTALPRDEMVVYVHRQGVLPAASQFTVVRGDANGFERVKTQFIQEEMKRNPKVAQHPFRIFSDQMSEPLRSTSDLERVAAKAGARDIHLFYRLDTSRTVDTVKRVQTEAESLRPAPLSRYQRELVESAARAREKAMHIAAAITAPTPSPNPISWKQQACDNIASYMQLNPACADHEVHAYAVDELLSHAVHWTPKHVANQLVTATPTTTAGMVAADLLNSVRSLSIERIGGDPRDIRRGYSSRLIRSPAWHGLDHVVHADPYYRHPRHHHAHAHGHVRYGKHDRHRIDHPHPLPRPFRYLDASYSSVSRGAAKNGVREYISGSGHHQPATVRAQPRVIASNPYPLEETQPKQINGQKSAAAKTRPSAAAMPAPEKQLSPAAIQHPINNDDSHLARVNGSYRPLPLNVDSVEKHMWGSHSKTANGMHWTRSTQNRSMKSTGTKSAAPADSNPPTQESIRAMREWHGARMADRAAERELRAIARANRKAHKRALRRARKDRRRARRAAKRAARAAALSSLAQPPPPGVLLTAAKASSSSSRGRSDGGHRQHRDKTGQYSIGASRSRSSSSSRSRTPPRNQRGEWKHVEGKVGRSRSRSRSSTPPRNQQTGQWEHIQGGRMNHQRSSRSRSRSRSPPRNNEGQFKNIPGVPTKAMNSPMASASATTAAAAAKPAPAASAASAEKLPTLADYELKPLPVDARRTAMAKTSSTAMNDRKGRTGIRVAPPSATGSTIPSSTPTSKTSSIGGKASGSAASPATPAPAPASAAASPKAAPRQDTVDALLSAGANEFNLRVTNHATVMRPATGGKPTSTTIEVGYYVAMPQGITSRSLPNGPWTTVGVVPPHAIKTFRLKTGPEYTFVFVDKATGEVLNVRQMHANRSGDYTITVHGKDDDSEIKFRAYSPAAIAKKGTAFLRQRLPMGVNGTITSAGKEYPLSGTYTELPVGVHSVRYTFADPNKKTITSTNSLVLHEDTHYSIKNVGEGVSLKVEDDFGVEKLATYAPGVKPVANSVVFVNQEMGIEHAPRSLLYPKKVGDASMHGDQDYSITGSKGTVYTINPSHAHIWDANDDKVPVLAIFNHPEDLSCTVMVVAPSTLEKATAAK